MTFRAYLFTYIFGGLTFIPLLLAAILIPAWYLQPRVSNIEATKAGNGSEGEKPKSNEEESGNAKETGHTNDAAASGTFAVLRRYDFQAAITAINARNNTGSSNANDGNAVGENGGSSTGESVYQSMYRSVFVGNKNTNSTTSLLQSEDLQDGSPNRKRVAPANVLYIVLRHGHLMLYDSPAQVEVKHVLSMAHHSVSLQAGKDDDEDGLEKHIQESDLFIKRTAIVLTPKELPNGALQGPAQSPAKPFYLFSATNIEKEDFYHALLSTRAHPPKPRPLNAEALIKLQSALHSSSLTAETRALDAIIGRVFLSLHNTDVLRNFVRGKIEKKLARIQKPTFIPSLRVRSIDLGDAGPVFTNLKLRDLNISGEMTVEANMKYNGGLSLTLLAVAKLDLGPRFKARTVDLVLKTSVQRISGTMILKIKPPPSNRLWFCFDTVPEMEIRVEPVVSERKITYGFVLRAIEERVRTAISEGLVRPNWDDIPMPFSDTRGNVTRGGLWSDEGKPDSPIANSVSTGHVANDTETTHSLPSLSKQDAIDTAISTGNSASEVNLTRLRHASTMSVDSDTLTTLEKPPRPPRPMRSPSVSTSSVAMDDQSVSSIRSEGMPPPQRTLWASRNRAPLSQKDALEELRGIHSRVGNQPPAESESDDEIAKQTPDTADARSLTEASDGSGSTMPATPRSFSIRSTDSDRSTAPSSIGTTRGEQLQSKKANILAATAAATTAARNWGWNAIQRQKNNRAVSQGDVQQEPMGRGQPLPPPGQPLPGPQKGIWGGVSSLRRKPVPVIPARKPTAAREAPSSSKDGAQVAAEEMQDEDEFEPFQENSGIEGPDENTSKSDSASRKTPPPLPARRQRPIDSAESLVSLSTEKTTEEDVENAPALRIPDSSVDAINAENSTPERAHGAFDDTSHLAHDEAVDADMSGEDNQRAFRDDTPTPTQARPLFAGHENEQDSFPEPIQNQQQNSFEHPMPDLTSEKEDPCGDEEVLSRIRARVKERTPLVERVAESSTASPRNERDSS
ncbi:hypothetical protein AC579_6344 [Pseudocercospora musae]|uniref:SMP-LTD domain-containing protein n=1 Tax=Pseudocercospora musae TaxID=113226 RepID=A0A139I7E1_9PEZI|nr:hypothetical protein AC579_6344 [Pseudocercospora musae]KXT10667.1 hypothetical protein AC579_6344 [Pseudocercospora musae]